MGEHDSRVSGLRRGGFEVNAVYNGPVVNDAAKITHRVFWLISVAWYATVSLWLFAPVLASPRSVVSAPDMDIDRYFFAIRSFFADQVRAGHFPLWNPYTFGGMPTLGNFQYAMLYPPTWLHAVAPTHVAINLIVAFHFALAGCLAAAWCRFRGASVVGSLMGGTIFMLSGPLMSRLYGGHLTFLCVVAWSPSVLMAVDAIIENRRRKFAVLLGAVSVTLLILAGYPQPAYGTLLTAMIYGTARVVVERHRPVCVAWIGLMIALGLAMAAGQLLPAMDASREFVRTGRNPFDFAASYSLPPENLLTLIMPHPFGDEFTLPYLGRWGLWETSVFVGPVAVVLAVVGVSCGAAAHDRGLGIVAVAALVVAMGMYTPVYEQLWRWLPGMKHFRGPARFGFLATLAIAVLAARGFDQIVTTRSLLRSATLVAGLAAVTGVASIVLHFNHRPWTALLEMMRLAPHDARTAPLDSSMTLRSASFAAQQFAQTALSLAQISGVMAILGAAHTRYRRPIAMMLPLLGVIHLTMATERYCQHFQPRLRFPPDLELEAQQLSLDERMFVIRDGWLNLPTQLGIENVTGYDPSLSRRWGRLVGALVGANPLLGSMDGTAVRPLPIISALRASLHNTQLHPMPRASLVARWRIVTDESASLAAALQTDFDPCTEVILEQEPGIASSEASLPLKPVQVIRRSLDSTEVAVEATQPSILLMTDAYDRGWRVRSLRPDPPQVAYDVLPADHALLAVPLMAGTHHLLIEYRPTAVIAGFAISAAAVTAWCIAAVLMIVSWPRSRRSCVGGFVEKLPHGLQ